MFEPYPGIQVILMFYQSVLVIAYLVYVRPFETRGLNRLEIFNEVCILCSAYHLIMFTEYVRNQVLSDEAGTTMIAITILNISVNMGVMIVVTVKKTKGQILQLWARFSRWRAKKYQVDERVKKSGFIAMVAKNLKTYKNVEIAQERIVTENAPIV